MDAVKEEMQVDSMTVDGRDKVRWQPLREQPKEDQNQTI